MAQVTPLTALPADSDTTGAVQVTGASLRCSVRATALTTLALIRMDPSGKWFRITDDTGKQMQFTAQPGGDAGNTDVSFTLPAASSNEYYNLIAESTFTGYAELDSLSAPPGPGGSVPTSRTLTPVGGVTLDGGTSAVDLSTDRTIGLGGTANMTLSTGSLTWAGAASKAGSLIAGTTAALTLGANGVAVASVDSGGLGLVLAANKNLSCSAGTTIVDLSAGTGTFKPPTGIFTFQGKRAATATASNITDPGNAGAIPVTTDGVCNLTSAGAETRTLAIPTFQGQRLNLCMNVDGGDIVITVASAFNQATNTTITMNDAGDSVELVGVLIASALRWRLVYNDGCTLG